MPKAFEKLAKTVKREYVNKGYGVKRATAIGYATANKVYALKRGRK